MAKKTVVQLCDDLDGIADKSVQTITFSLDGVHYEIDLKPDNANTLRTRLNAYINRARRIGDRPNLDPAPHRSGRDRELSQKIRQWAKSNNWTISHYGRLPIDIVDAYQQAMPRSQRR